MRIDIVTLFPGMFQGPFEESMVRIARERGRVDLRIIDLRLFADEPHRKVDDRPYGGGPGMVLAPGPVFRAIEHLTNEAREAAEKQHEQPTPPRYLLTSPQGERLTQARSWQLSTEEHLIVVCGHYEGFDERILEGFPFLELSIGDYILTGGEIPAMAIVDSIVRLIPGVVGDPESIEQESFEGGLLDCPHYTRPYEFRGNKVPDVLLSGDHRKIAEWRNTKARERTVARRGRIHEDGGGSRDTSCETGASTSARTNQ